MDEWYIFEGLLAIDEQSGGIARNAEGHVYALADTTFATPLPVTDLQGVPLTALTSNQLGYIPSFKCQTRIALWKSGPYIIPVWSIQGVLEDIVEARQAAEDAAIAAQQAAEAAAGGTGGGSLPENVASTEQLAEGLALKRDKAVPGTFPVQLVAGAWEYTTLAAAQAAGLQAGDLIVFVGLLDPPTWAGEHPRISLWTQGG